MSKKHFKEYFWYYPQVVITILKKKALVFDDDLFFSEKKYLFEYLPDRQSAESHFVAFQAYLFSNIATANLVESVNTVMQIMYESVMNGNTVLNENTKFTFHGSSATEALEGIFSAYHETSLLNSKLGRFEVSAKPLSYDDDNLIIRLIYYERVGVLTKLLNKDPPIRREEIIESNKIKEITGDSNAMIISLFDGQGLLEVTPYTTRWIKPQ